MNLLAPFILQNFLKKFLERIQSYEDVSFLGPKFLVQTIIITFIYLLALFIVQNLKAFLQQIQSYVDVPFLGPKYTVICIIFWCFSTPHSTIPFWCNLLKQDLIDR